MFMELIIENKEEDMDGYLFNLKFAVQKTGLEIFCDVVLISTIHFIIQIISIRCGMSEYLIDEVSWFLSALRPKPFSVEGEKIISVWRGMPCHFLSKFGSCSHAKIRRYKTL